MLFIKLGNQSVKKTSANNVVQSSKFFTFKTSKGKIYTDSFEVQLTGNRSVFSTGRKPLCSTATLIIIQQDWNATHFGRLRRCLSGLNMVGDHKTSTYIEKHGANRSIDALLDACYFTLADIILLHFNEWTFNIFSLEKMTNGHGLSYIVHKLFMDYNFSSLLGIDMFRLLRFIKLVEQGYHESNSYHNSTHAADVVHAMNFNIHEEKIFGFLKNEEKMAAILAAACHDIDHPGVNQSFLISTGNPLSFLYHGKSVLENHHYRVTKSLIFSTGLLKHLDAKAQETVDKILSATILATDISLQSEFITSFKSYLHNGSLDLKRQKKDRTFILQIALKCADICNPCRPWPLCYQWSEMICEEFFKQGDCEAKLGLPVLPPFDRQNSNMATVQTGFIRFLAKPLFTLWDDFVKSKHSDMLLSQLHHNESQWNLLSSTKPTFTELYLVDGKPRDKYRKVLDVESKNIYKSQNKNINMLIAKNYNRKPTDLLETGNSNEECLKMFCMKRRHSTPAHIVRCMTSTTKPENNQKDAPSQPVASVITNSQPFKPLENRSYERKVASRRASFPMNVCIVQRAKPGCFKGNEKERLSLAGFSSFYYVTAASKRLSTREHVALISSEGGTWPIALRGVLGFGPRDRMTALCKHLLQYKTNNLKEVQNTINSSGDISIMSLLNKESFNSTLVS